MCIPTALMENFCPERRRISGSCITAGMVWIWKKTDCTICGPGIIMWISNVLSTRMWWKEALQPARH